MCTVFPAGACAVRCPLAQTLLPTQRTFTEIYRHAPGRRLLLSSRMRGQDAKGLKAVSEHLGKVSAEGLARGQREGGGGMHEGARAHTFRLSA